MRIRYAHLYPELQFQLSCAINSHQGSIVATQEETAFAFKRTNPEQMGRSAPRTKAEGLSPDNHDNLASRGFGKVSTGSAPNVQLFSVKEKPLFSLGLTLLAREK